RSKFSYGDSTVATEFDVEVTSPPRGPGFQRHHVQRKCVSGKESTFGKQGYDIARQQILDGLLYVACVRSLIKKLLALCHDRRQLVSYLLENSFILFCRLYHAAPKSTHRRD